MPPSVVLLFACAKRKCAVPIPPAIFSDLKPAEVKLLATQWLANTASLTPKFAAIELYRGASWVVYRDVLKKLPNSQGYVVSAGFGLVSLTASRLPPYSATFASGEDCIADTVIAPGVQTRSAKHRSWWNALTQSQSSCCADLAGRYPQACFVVVGGNDYIEALQDDLGRLRKYCGSERLFIICAGYSSPPGSLLADCIIPATVKMESMLPGARSGLNARVLQWLVTQIVPRTGWNHSAIAYEIAQHHTCSAIRSKETVARIRLSDHEVCEKLLQNIISNDTDRPLSATQMLKYLRANGFACEEKRFRRIYQEKIAQSISIPSFVQERRVSP